MSDKNNESEEKLVAIIGILKPRQNVTHTVSLLPCSVIARSAVDSTITSQIAETWMYHRALPPALQLLLFVLVGGHDHCA